MAMKTLAFQKHCQQGPYNGEISNLTPKSYKKETVSEVPNLVILNFDNFFFFFFYLTSWDCMVGTN